MNFLKFEKKDQVGILTFNRPEALNALNKNVLEELLDFLSNRVIEEKIKVLILTGEGEKAFIAGADIKEMQPLNHLQMIAFSQLGQKVTCLLEEMNLVTIAAVNGYALGGGLEMALGCDFIYASSNAKLGLPEVSLGLIPGFGGTQRLSRVLGTRLAKEMIFSARHISAEKALSIGLINDMFEPEDLMDACLKTADQILKNSFVAIIEAKQAINSGFNLSLHNALELEQQMFGVISATNDSREGMSAFTEKRKASFTDII